MILELDKDMSPFYQPSDQTKMTAGCPKEYLVDKTISLATLQDLIFFAYHRRLELTEQSSLLMVTIGAQYGIKTLVKYCLDYLRDHFSPSNVFKAFQLASDERFANQNATEYFQEYIEDHFEEVSYF